MAAFAITGATGSIGGALARRLAAAGHGVLLLGRNDAALAALGAELGQPHEALDVCSAAALQAAFASAAGRWGRLDGVAHCVGTVLLKPAHLTTDEEFRATLEANLFSAFAVVKAAAGTMKEGGSVVLFSSAAAEIGIMNHEAIAAAKAGIEGLMRSAAASYASRNLRFNCLRPGLVKSTMTRRLWENPAAAAASQELHALGRLGEPEQLAAAAAFLLDPAHDWITGQCLGVDGGLGRVLPKRKS
jgi:NAD(P)-dependent dehydrogenase (short-subunit alcohol dehydrogenase family)